MGSETKLRMVLMAAERGILEEPEHINMAIIEVSKLGKFDTLGNLYRLAGNEQEALKCYEKHIMRYRQGPVLDSISLVEKCAKFAEDKIGIERAITVYEDAETYFSDLKIDAIRQDSGWWYAYAGDLAGKAGNKDKASDFYEKQIQKNTRVHVSTETNVGFAREKLGIRRAIKIYEDEGLYYESAIINVPDGKGWVTRKEAFSFPPAELAALVDSHLSRQLYEKAIQRLEEESLNKEPERTAILLKTAVEVADRIGDMEKASALREALLIFKP